jgi:pyruvate dehydrogenase (quinone)
MARRTILTTIADRLLPFAAMAQEISVRGFSLTEPADVEQGIADALAHDDPVLIGAVVAERRSLCRLQSGSEMFEAFRSSIVQPIITVAPTRPSRRED